jgi:hypothetical protein
MTSSARSRGVSSICAAEADFALQTAANIQAERITMATFSLHAQELPDTRSPRNGFAQLVSGLKTVFDLFAEADRLGGQARQRYPFAD